MFPSVPCRHKGIRMSHQQHPTRSLVKSRFHLQGKRWSDTYSVGSFLPTSLFSAHGNSTKSGKLKTNALKSAEVLREERQQTATPYRRHRLVLDHGGGGVRHGAALLLGVECVPPCIYLRDARSANRPEVRVQAFSRSAGGVEVKSAPSLHVHKKKATREREQPSKRRHHQTEEGRRVGGSDLGNDDGGRMYPISKEGPIYLEAGKIFSGQA